MKAERNLNGVQLERVRKRIDPVFNALHDELEEAYYKHWKLGISKPFYGYDYVAGEDNKLKFDQLHGYLWAVYAVARHRENLELPENERYAEHKYNVAQRDKWRRVLKTKDQEGLEWIKTAPKKIPLFIEELHRRLKKQIIAPE